MNIANSIKEMFRRHSITIYEKDKARLQLWLSDLSEDQQDSLAVALEERYDAYRAEAKQSGWSILQSMFPQNKDYDWPIASMIEDIKGRAAREKENAQLDGLGLKELTTALRIALREWNDARQNPLGTDEDVDSRERAYHRLELAWKQKVRNAVHTENTDVLKQATLLCHNLAVTALLPVVGSIVQAELILAACKEDRLRDAVERIEGTRVKQ